MKDDQNLRTVFQMSCVTDRLERQSSRNIRKVRKSAQVSQSCELPLKTDFFFTLEINSGMLLLHLKCPVNQVLGF